MSGYNNMFSRLMKASKKITDNPFTNIIVGLVLLYSGVSESLHEFKELEAFRLGVHHGVIFFAVLHLMKSLHEVADAAERFQRLAAKE